MNRPEASQHSVIWEWHDGSYDRAQIIRETQGWRVAGRHGDIRYLIKLDAGFLCQSLEVTSDAAGITLNRTSAGWFETNTGLLPGSANVFDLDLSWTAVTNTFPIKRLDGNATEAGTFDVVMVTAPDLEMKVMQQSYTKWQNGWVYGEEESGYTADLTVDKFGLVTDYPGLCSRKDLS
ncbi:putative DNA-binding response regulator [Sulfitobacter noctilucae]|uniref:putative glycolipid-binding domain-containing protein n=1 Tax=Sulfitobacter noctilucae TaxID=1342302 RepID=UPI00046ACD52|nr:putative glycolipid-binding domain-containing protein [Sulfitobacter noctilucae]KIN65281.1 putative DNA-binding response regulator [Sulfitobacter noctilucae]